MTVVLLPTNLRAAHSLAKEVREDVPTERRALAVRAALHAWRDGASRALAAEVGRAVGRCEALPFPVPRS